MFSCNDNVSFIEAAIQSKNPQSDYGLPINSYTCLIFGNSHYDEIYNVSILDTHRLRTTYPFLNEIVDPTLTSCQPFVAKNKRQKKRPDLRPCGNPYGGSKNIYVTLQGQTNWSNTGSFIVKPHWVSAFGEKIWVGKGLIETRSTGVCCNHYAHKSRKHLIQKLKNNGNFQSDSIGLGPLAMEQEKYWNQVNDVHVLNFLSSKGLTVHNLK